MQTQPAELYRDSDALERLAGAWEALPVPTVFLTLPWARAWWSAYAANRRPFIVVCREGGDTLSALAPLCLGETRVGPLRAGRLLTWIGGGEACADHLDFIVPPGEAAAAARDALLAQLWQARGEWDGLLLTDLPERSPTVAALRRWAAAHSLRIDEAAQDVCPILPLPGDWAAVEASLSGHFRRHLRRDARRLEEHGARVWFCDDARDLEGALDVLEALHAARREAEGGRSAFDRPSFRAFHRTLARALLERGKLRLALLQSPRGPLAAVYGFAHEDVTSFYQSGLGNTLPQFSRGQVLLAAVIRRSVEEGARCFDFLRGVDAYKSRWTQETRRTVTIFVASSTIGGQWAWLARHGRRHVRSLMSGRRSQS